MARKYRIKIEGEERIVDVVQQSENDYVITLDGKTYVTHVEDARDSASGVTQPAVTISPTSKPASASRARESNSPLQKPPAADERGTIRICAPLTGTVTSTKVASGAKVERGQLLCLLEAMKMELEVLASQNGVIVSVGVEPSDTVQQGDLLFVLQADGIE